MNSERNEVCSANPKGCWICECGKHHNCKEGADYCCTKKEQTKCDCRHCEKCKSLKEAIKIYEENGIQ